MIIGFIGLFLSVRVCLFALVYVSFDVAYQAYSRLSCTVLLCTMLHCTALRCAVVLYTVL